MGRIIIKIKDQYLDWSTIVDAPVTDGMTLGQFLKYYKQEYEDSLSARQEFLDRLERVEETGTSAKGYDSVEELVSFNRAGPKESCLTLDEIYQAYCLKQPIRRGWLPT